MARSAVSNFWFPPPHCIDFVQIDAEQFIFLPQHESILMMSSYRSFVE